MQCFATRLRWPFLVLISLTTLTVCSPASPTLAPTRQPLDRGSPTVSQHTVSPSAISTGVVINEPQQTLGTSFYNITDEDLVDVTKNQSCFAINQGLYDARCWNILNVEVYLNDPIIGWNQTVPICGVRGDPEKWKSSSTCCDPTEPWSTCFLRLATLNPGLDCTSLETPLCSFGSKEIVARSIAPQVHYVLKNIICKSQTSSAAASVCVSRSAPTNTEIALNKFFSVYWTALQFAISSASFIVRPLILRMDPYERTTWPGSAILVMFTFALAYIGVPQIQLWLYKFDKVRREAKDWVPFAASSFAISLQNSPPTTRMLIPHFPAGTVGSEDYQAAQLDDMLAKTAGPMEAIMTNALTQLMTDVPSFIHFVEGTSFALPFNFSLSASLTSLSPFPLAGQFSGPENPPLPEKTAGLTFALKTYMSSVALTANDWVIYPAVETYYDSFFDACPNPANSTAAQFNICSDESGVARYWSSDTHRLYLLRKQSDQLSQKYFDTTALLLDIIAYDWAALNVLFDGSYNCTAAGKQGTTGPIRFNWDGTLNIACTSQMTQVVGCNDYCPLLEDGSCPFLPNDGQCHGQTIL